MPLDTRQDCPSILVVEDEFIIALDLSETVADLGYRVEGPFGSSGSALCAIERTMPDLAILDVFTADGEVFPLADVLTNAGVPIIFHSGHACAGEMQARYPGSQVASKPCRPDRIIALVREALGPEKTAMPLPAH